jgi:Flp pilus assembly protein TadG
MTVLRQRGEAGLTSTEVAVLMPVVIALVLAPFQVGLWWHAKQVADGAARHAVDVAQVEGATEADGEAAAERFLDAAGNLEDPTVTVARGAETVVVEVTGQAPRLLPGFDWQVTARASAPVERFIPEPDR